MVIIADILDDRINTVKKCTNLDAIRKQKIFFAFGKPKRSKQVSGRHPLFKIRGIFDKFNHRIKLLKWLKYNKAGILLQAFPLLDIVILNTGHSLIFRKSGCGLMIEWILPSLVIH